METIYDALNSVLVSTRDQIKDMNPSNWFVQEDFAYAEFKLQLHRFNKKFMEPNESIQKELERQCSKRYLKNEKRLKKFDRQLFKSWPLVNLYKVRQEVKSILGNFRFEPRRAWFGPGETFASSSGDVSVYSKLVSNEWTVTKDCIPLLKLVIRNNRVFRRIMLERARAVLSQKAENTFKELLSVIRLRSPGSVAKISELLYRLRDEVRKSRSKRPDPITFDEQIALTWRLVSGGRFSSVPKDNLKRRPINVEPLGNMLVQRAIGRSLKEALRRSGNDLFTGQSVHQRLITNLGVATIDLSDASDSISWKLIHEVFPPSFVKLLDKSRSRYSRVEREWVTLKKVSSMGNGFTFEVLTILLLALTRSLGAKVARVYGDDIIVDVEQAHELYDLLAKYGFIVNQDKSFADGLVRESCGAFTHGGRPMLSYDIEWLENDLDAVVLANKLYNLKNDSTSRLARMFWGDVWHRVVELLPLSSKGPVPYDRYASSLGDYVWDESIEENYKSEGASLWIEKNFQLARNSVHRVQVLRIKPVNVDLRDIPWVGLRKSRLIHLGKLLRLMTKAPVMRFNANREECISETWFCDRRGLLISRSQYKSARNQTPYTEPPSCWGESYKKNGAVEFKDLAILAFD